MRERPIIFSGPMIRAILDGSKTQTRRPVKRENDPSPGLEWAECLCREIDPADTPCVVCDARFGASPYGEPGDRLWVREAWRAPANLDDKSPKEIEAYETPWCPIRYEADGAVDNWPALWPHETGRYRHARFMPRWLSRLTLDVISTRVERVKDISREDAEAEGFSFDSMRGTPLTVVDPNGSERTGEFAWAAPEYAFSCAWEGAYPGSWQRNDWVWVIEFRRSGGDS